MSRLVSGLRSAIGCVAWLLHWMDGWMDGWFGINAVVSLCVVLSFRPPMDCRSEADALCLVLSCFALPYLLIGLLAGAFHVVVVALNQNRIN